MLKSLFIFLTLFISLQLVAQISGSPNGFNYSAVARDASGKVLSNKNISLKLSILKGSPGGSVQYSEQHNLITDGYGLFALVVGRGTAQIGNFNAVNWGNDKHYLQTALDANGGINFVTMGTTQLLSVPYALHANTADSIINGGFNGNYNDLINKPIVINSLSVNGDTLNLSDGRTFIAKKDLLNGTINNQLTYWDGNNWVILNPGKSGQTLTICDGVLTWTTGGICEGKITGIKCDSVVITGTSFEGVAVSGVSVEIPYAGGNGGAFSEQKISSTEVTGLIATIESGNFLNGNGILKLKISGVALQNGTAKFLVKLGAISCEISLKVKTLSDAYPSGTVFCEGVPTAIVNITNPITGKIWMDRNLGAKQVAVDVTDENSFGDLYQWGRGPDGHQCRTSPTTDVLSSSENPGHDNFIISESSPFDWKTTQNPNLWQGLNGINNPCPNGYRLPTNAEFEEERSTWVYYAATGAFSSLKMPIAGSRSASNAWIFSGLGYYWTSTLEDAFYPFVVRIIGGNSGYEPGNGCSVRCIKD